MPDHSCCALLHTAVFAWPFRRSSRSATSTSPVLRQRPAAPIFPVQPPAAVVLGRFECAVFRAFWACCRVSSSALRSAAIALFGGYAGAPRPFALGFSAVGRFGASPLPALGARRSLYLQRIHSPMRSFICILPPFIHALFALVGRAIE
jgi:hypothetical protein